MIRAGRVRLNGQEGSARTFGEGEIYPAGAAVRVMQIAGAAAVQGGDRDGVAQPQAGG